MKKVVLTGLLAVASMMSVSQFAAAQQADITLPPAELNAWTAAQGQTAPAAKAQALEAFLTQYPNSQVKTYALEQLVQAYIGSDQAKIVPAADRLLQADPNNLRGLAMDVFFRKQQADPLTDATQKQAALDQAADLAQKGLAAFATKPAKMSDADFNSLKTIALPTFYATIADADLGKSDTAGAEDNFKKELGAMPVEQTQNPARLDVLIDEFLLGQAYLQQKPADMLSCAYYTSRAANFAAEPQKSQMTKMAQYCYKTYHGKADGFEAFQALAAASLNPPTDLATKVTPAPLPKDMAHDAVTSTPDLTQLALDDREFILANGTMKDASGQTDADKVWATMKGKSYTIPDAVVVSATPTQLMVAVSQAAQGNNVADFTVNLKAMDKPEEPKAKTPPAMGAYRRKMAEYDRDQAALAALEVPKAKITFSGTYDSYTTTPTLMITMTDGEVQLPKAAAAPAHAGPRRPGGRR